MKIYYIIIGVFIFIFATTWIFNHVNPWFAIGFFVGGLGYTVHKIINSLK